jgi:hypothetical protein
MCNLPSVGCLTNGWADARLFGGQSGPVIDRTQSKQTAKRIPLRLSGNSDDIVPVLINGRIWRDFTIDTGASDVTIPLDVAKTLILAGTITKEDIGSEQNYRLANGGTVTNTKFRIHSLQVGEGDNAVIVRNVDGSIGGSQGSLLLGQSFLRRFRSTTIDHVNSVLIIDGSEPLAVVSTAAPAHPDAAALRDAAINPASLAINVRVGTLIGGGAVLWDGSRVPYGPMGTDLIGTVVNYSNKTLRAIEIKVRARDCPQCLVTDEWKRKIDVDVPPGQQRNLGYVREAWRIVPDGKFYTWQLLTASACSWDGRGNNSDLVCP